ncbi:MAG: lactate racemase domain-containing protein [Myxococcota bacterium]
MPEAHANPAGARSPALSLRCGRWYGDREVALDLPAGWTVRRLDPQDAPALDDDAIQRAFEQPIGTPRLRELARGRRSAVLAIDDLTRPTPVHRFLPRVIDELLAGGIDASEIRILIGTAAHRPAGAEEAAKKLGRELARRFPPLVHDFMGPEIRFVGWIRGGPVYLDRRFLAADLRICIGGAVPHDETGFGGGAKMVVPGVAGRLTIAHFHGALPPRPAGQLEAKPGQLDRRAWSEAVARRVGVDAVVCAAVNSRAELAGLAVGDLVEAHRAAAQRAIEIGRTPVPREWAERADVVVVNAYPLDTDPIQMGKSVRIARTFRAPCTVVVNGASDGVFYHGMGMGSGVSSRRLLRNIPGLLGDPTSLWSWLRGMGRGIRAPELAARLTYFSLNHLSYASFASGEGRLGPELEAATGRGATASPLVWSPRFPGWGFRRKYRGGRLFREWSELRDTLGARFERGEMLVLPCAPLQLPEIR